MKEANERFEKQMRSPKKKLNQNKFLLKEFYEKIDIMCKETEARLI